MKTAIITGITGQDGAYLSKLLIDKGYRVIGLNNNKISDNFSGLEYLNVLDKVVIEDTTMLDIEEWKSFIQKYNPSEIYNLAAQSSVGMSFKIPMETINFNITSLLCLLESIRIINPAIKVFQAASGEIFGNVKNLPITEETIINPESPYAVSKASTYFIVKTYRESYNLFISNGIFFNHESFLRPDSFVIKKVIKEALNIKSGKQENIKVGNLDVYRDFGYAPKYVEVAWLMLQQEHPDDFIICSGKLLSLKEIVYSIFDKLSISKDKIVVDPILYRPVEILESYGDNTKIKEKLGWDYNLEFSDVLDILITEEIENNYPALKQQVRI